MSDIENYLSDDGSDSDYDDASSVDSDTSSLGSMTKTQPLTIKKTIEEVEAEIEEDVDDGDDDVEEEIEEEDDDYDDEENEIDDDYEDMDKEKKAKSINTKKPSATVLEDYMEESGDENDEDHEEMEERYLQKFDTEINKNYIMDFHPESFINNYDEIVALTNVVRDDMNNIVDPFHKTIPFLTKYEKTRVLGMRAKQINSGCQTFVKVPEHIIDGYLIAEMELKEKRIPFIMRRPLPNGGFEYWNLKDLEIIN